MKNEHENLLDRTDNTLVFYNANKEAIDVVKVLRTGFADLGVRYLKMSAERSGGEMDLSPFAELKEETLERAAFIAAGCAGPLRSYAKAAGLAAILGVVPAAATAYAQGRGKLLLTRFDTLRKHYAEQLPNMADYNTSADSLKKLDEVVAEIKGAMSMPATARSERKLTNREIDATAREIYALYRNVLNPNMEAFRLDQPELHKAWLEASRVIHTAATRETSEDGEVAAARAAARTAAAQARAAKAALKAESAKAEAAKSEIAKATDKAEAAKAATAKAEAALAALRGVSADEPNSSAQPETETPVERGEPHANGTAPASEASPAQGA